MDKTPKAKAKLIEERLARIAAQGNGCITPDAVIADAKDSRSPLHDQFEWDDSVAAHQYRLDQARALIRTVKCRVDIVSNTLAAPSYVRDPRAGGESQGYVSIAKVATQADLARNVLRDEMGRVVAAMERARSIADVLGLTDDLDKLLAMIAEIKNRAKAA